MPLNTGHAKLTDSLKVLHAQWERIQDVWSDVVSREFGEQVMEPLHSQVQATLRATDRFDLALTQMFRDCDDR